jgi:hypothetical protein
VQGWWQKTGHWSSWCQPATELFVTGYCLQPLLSYAAKYMKGWSWTAITSQSLGETVFLVLIPSPPQFTWAVIIKFFKSLSDVLGLIFWCFHCHSNYMMSLLESCSSEIFWSWIYASVKVACRNTLEKQTGRRLARLAAPFARYRLASQFLFCFAEGRAGMPTFGY